MYQLSTYVNIYNSKKTGSSLQLKQLKKLQNFVCNYTLLSQHQPVISAADLTKNLNQQYIWFCYFERTETGESYVKSCLNIYTS